MDKFIEKERTAKEIKLGRAPRKMLNPEWMEPLDETAEKLISKGAKRGQLSVSCEFEGVQFNYNLECHEFVSGGKVQDEAISKARKSWGV